MPGKRKRNGKKSASTAEQPSKKKIKQASNRKRKTESGETTSNKKAKAPGPDSLIKNSSAAKQKPIPIVDRTFVKKADGYYHHPKMDSIKEVGQLRDRFNRYINSYNKKHENDKIPFKFSRKEKEIFLAEEYFPRWQKIIASEAANKKKAAQNRAQSIPLEKRRFSYDEDNKRWFHDPKDIPEGSQKAERLVESFNLHAKKAGLDIDFYPKDSLVYISKKDHEKWDAAIKVSTDAPLKNKKSRVEKPATEGSSNIQQSKKKKNPKIFVGNREFYLIKDGYYYHDPLTVPKGGNDASGIAHWLNAKAKELHCNFKDGGFLKVHGQNLIKITGRDYAEWQKQLLQRKTEKRMLISMESRIFVKKKDGKFHYREKGKEQLSHDLLKYFKRKSKKIGCRFKKGFKFSKKRASIVLTENDHNQWIDALAAEKSKKINKMEINHSSTHCEVTSVRDQDFRFPSKFQLPEIQKFYLSNKIDVAQFSDILKRDRNGFVFSNTPTAFRVFVAPSSILNQYAVYPDEDVYLNEKPIVFTNYEGEHINQEEYEKTDSFNIIKACEDDYIVADNNGNVSVLVNHSFDANLEAISDYNHGDLWEVKFLVKKPIKKYEQLYVNYRKKYFHNCSFPIIFLGPDDNWESTNHKYDRLKSEYCSNVMKLNEAAIEKFDLKKYRYNADTLFVVPEIIKLISEKKYNALKENISQCIDPNISIYAVFPAQNGYLCYDFKKQKRITGLMYACANADEEAVQILLTNTNTDVNRRTWDTGKTSLHFALESQVNEASKYSIIKMLVEKNANLSIKDWNSKTYLDYCNEYHLDNDIKSLITPGFIKEESADTTDFSLKLLHSTDEEGSSSQHNTAISSSNNSTSTPPYAETERVRFFGLNKDTTQVSSIPDSKMNSTPSLPSLNNNSGEGS